MAAQCKVTWMSHPADAVLTLHNLRHRYAARETFAGLDLALAPGSICCLLGPSGCGKTTVLRCIAGFERLSEGSIRIDGATVSSAAEHLAPERRRVGMVFQDYALFPHLSVERNVAFGVCDDAVARERAAQLLEVVGLAGMGKRFPHELSGGQQQRVALARALAPQPRLLLLDEPFSNLDVALREQLAVEVRAILKAAGTTAVFVTHDQNEAFALADEIAVMNDGCIQQLDSAYNLYHRPANRFVADFIGQGVFVEATVLDAQRLRIELGEVRSATPIVLPGATAPPATGSRVDVLLRPDDVVHDDASPVQASVMQRAFRGAQILYTLRTDGGARVLSMVPSHHNHRLGERIGIRLDMDHVIAFEPVQAGHAPGAAAG
jgi:iron(III) transport system ATP-binding protein